MTGKIRRVKSIKGIQSLVDEICKITQSKSNCQRLQYEIHFILCLCKIESSERKKIARKQVYNIVHLSKVRWNLLKRNIQLQGEKKTGRSGYRICIEQCKNKIRKGHCYICCVCNRLLYKRSIHTE